MTDVARASVFIATSLDGFIARSDGALDWLPVPADDDYGYNAFIATVDAIVMGRRTFETVRTFGSWPYGKMPVIVLSTQPSAVKPPANAICEAMSGTPDEVAASLAQRGMRHLYIDGGVTIQKFLEAGLIQWMTITRVPILLGSGLPLFGPLSRDVKLEHVATRAYSSGLVQSDYRVIS